MSAPTGPTDPGPSGLTGSAWPGHGTPPASPPANRVRGRSWRDPRLATGVVIIAVCGLLGGLLLGRTDDNVALWAAARPIAAGQQVTAADLVRREVRFDDPADADRYLSAGSAVPAGATARRAVGSGELVPREALGGTLVGRFTEVPLSVAADALPGTVRVGSVVDVWVTPNVDRLSASDRARDAELVFDDVTVVSLGAVGGSLGPSTTRQVIIGVAADQLPRLPGALTSLTSGAVVLTRQR